jgi:ornithine cyclodeaminase/alanine dehydrogenase-like protein (mu-crystallin family)
MPAAETIPYLSEEALAELEITTSEVVESIEALILGSARSTVWSAPKAVILPEDGRYMMAALAAADDPPLLAVKTVVLNPRNPDRGLPQINGLVTMLDSDTGLPAAILDGNWITAVRTAGLSAVAAKYMARPDSSVIAFIGSGVQARSHLDAFADMFPLDEVRIFGRGRDNIDRLRRAAKALGKSAVVCASGREAVAGADLVVSSVTYSATLEPFLEADWMKPGSFAAITDLAAPWKKDSFAALGRIVIDDLQQEAALPNKLAPPDLVTGDLAGLVLGRFKGREQTDERSAFVFRGHALGDLALSALAFRKAGLTRPGSAEGRKRG